MVKEGSFSAPLHLQLCFGLGITNLLVQISVLECWRLFPVQEGRVITVHPLPEVGPLLVLCRIYLERWPIGSDLHVWGVLAPFDFEPLLSLRGRLTMLGKIGPHPHHCRTHFLVFICVDCVKWDERCLPHEEKFIGMT